MDESELYSSGDDDDISLTGSDFEFQLKTSGRKLTSTRGATSPQEVHPPSVSGSSSSQSQASKDSQSEIPEGHTHTSASHLYEAVRSGRSALQTVTDDWLDEYRRDREAGLLELINFIVQCSGCKGVVTREMFSSLQNADIISHLTKDFNEDSVSYPLVSLGPQWRHFREGVCEFVSLLVRGCRHTLLYDDFLFSSLIALLTGLADSQVRAFRHTSTLIAMRLMSSIVSVAADVNALALMTQRRCELEKNKPVEHRAVHRAEELENSYRELLEHQEDLRSLMNGIFKGVFVHRYRDRVPEIRAVCMQEMGVWIRDYPARFLNDEHLKYVGWMLHDKQAAVRLQCVLTLQKLYEQEFISRLELFTSRFRERMVCMILDKDSDVAVEAVKLMLLIQQQTEEGLSEDECAAVYPLVFSTHRGLACAAGAFLYHTLCSVLDKRSDKRSVCFLRLLAHFFIKSEYHDHAAYLVDSLWDVARAELKDWDVMTSLLLQEGGVEDELESALIDIMMCAVRQAAEATPPPPRSTRKTVTAREKRLQVQERKRITNHFIPVFPQLLAKFSADGGKVSRLLSAPLFFQLEVYGTSGRLEKCLDLLLSQVCDVLLKHSEECVLEACVRVLCALCADRYSFCGRVQRAVGQMLDSTVEKFSASLSEILQGSADEDDFYRAASSLNVLAIFSSARDMTGRNLFEFCFQLLKMGVETREINEKLMVPALKCAAFHLFWKGVTITQYTAETHKVELKRVLKSLHCFCVVCVSCLSAAQSHVRNQAFVCLCDVLLVFGSVCDGDGSPLQRFSPDESLKAEMASFIIDYVFSEEELNGEDEDEERKMAALLQRRIQLAGYCKLIIYGVLELRAATDILKYYNKFYRDFGDIIKETLSKTKMISSVESARTVCLCLQQLFSGLEQDRRDEEMMEIRFLAKKLAVNFSINLHVVREPLLALHQDGVRFASQGLEKGDLMNLGFLEILSEFSFKLLQPERKQLAADLRRVCSSALNSVFVRMYERSLTAGTRETAASAAHTPRRKRRRTQSSVAVETAAVIPDTRGDDMDDNDFADEFLRKSARRRFSPLTRSVQSHLSTLSLAHEDGSEDEEEPEIEDYDDEDSEMGFILPSTHGSASFLEDLFH
ncbi:cohesin subunit SA-2 [Pimephales promelas]|uniref:cohesin subunit SA-2 n=1 Tax=Pimephales promelas TaxID=90988 RepID=UPI0019558C3D|nr:cohesin subunit SA-2 [Pimephales promelas]KAG1934625.1 cohesin subunit SA-2 [Pimephales promelas]